MRSNRDQRQPARQSEQRTRQPQTQRPQERGYRESAGWGSAFRRDAEGNQPNYTGQILDPDGDELQIGIWIRTPRAGGPRYLRIHVEPPYQPEPDDELDDEPELPRRQRQPKDDFDQPENPADHDDIPF
jgi:hypothetical protein